MKKKILALFFVFSLLSVAGFAVETFRLWDGPAPGEPETTPPPVIEFWKPGVASTDACIIICPGGAYMGLAYDHEGNAESQRLC